MRALGPTYTSYYGCRLPALGFEIVEIEANGNYFEYMAQELHRIPTTASRYANHSLRPYEALAIGVILRMLKRFSKQGRESQELLCYGWFLRAVRV